MTDKVLESQKRLFSNAAILSTAEIVGQVVNFVFVICLARFFGPELLGLYAFGMAIGAVLCVLVSFGTHELLLRDLSRDPGRTAEVTGALFPFQALTGLALLLLVYGVSRWLYSAHEIVWILTLVVSFHVFTRLADLFTLGYEARQQMLPAALVQLAPRLGILLLGGLAILWWGMVAEIALASMPVAAALTLAAVYLAASHRFGRPRLRLRRREIGHYLRLGLPFFGVLLLAVLYGRLGVVYLTLLGGEAEAGLFASAERLVTAAGVVHMMFTGALFPLLARLWTQNREQFMEMVQRAMRLILFLTLPLATLIALFAQDTIMLLYGSKFSGAAPVLAAIAWALALRGISQLFSIVSMAADLQRTVLVSRALGVAVLTTVSFILVGEHGAMGLVAAVLISEMAAIAANILLLRRSGVTSLHFASGIRIAIACLIATGTAWLVADFELWVRLLAVTGGGMAALWGVGAIRSADVLYVRDIIKL